MQNQTYFVVVDPRPIHREGFVSVLKAGGADHCAAVSSVDNLSDFASSGAFEQPIIVIDVPEGVDDLPAMVYRMRKQLPGCRIVLLTSNCTDLVISQAIESNLEGLLDENIECDVLVKALELITLGQPIFLMHGAFARWEAIADAGQDACSLGELLSLREMEVLRALIEGQPNKVIARVCGITESTVKVHVKAILRKFRVKNRTQAAIWGQLFSRELRGGIGWDTRAALSKIPGLNPLANAAIQMQKTEAPAPPEPTQHVTPKRQKTHLGRTPAAALSTTDSR